MAPQLPRVYVLLLNWNGWRDTIECLESVFRMHHPDFRVIVCDNASSDGSVDAIVGWAKGEVPAASGSAALAPLTTPPVRKPIAVARIDRADAEDGRLPDVPLTLIETGANLGFAGGNNVGLAALRAAGATGLVWLLNNDMVVAPDALHHLTAALADDPGLGAVGATLLEYGEPDVVQAPAGGIVHRWQGMPRETSATGRRLADLGPDAPRIDFVSGGCLVTPIEVLERVGLLDDRYFMYAEDIDLSLRIRAAGWRIGWVREARVWHKDGRSSRPGSPFHDYQMVRSALLLVRSRFPRFLPLAMAYALYRCVLPKLFRGERSRLRAAWAAWRVHVTGRTTAADRFAPVPRNPVGEQA